MNLRLQVNGSNSGGSFNLLPPGLTQNIVTLPPRVIPEREPLQAPIVPTPPPPDTRTFIPVAVSLSGGAGSFAGLFSIDGIVRPLVRGTTVEQAPQVSAGACALVSGVPLCANLGYQRSYFPSLRSDENSMDSAGRMAAGQTEPVYQGVNVEATLASRGPWIRFIGDPNSNGVAWYWGRPLSELGFGLSVGQFSGGAAGQTHQTLGGLNLIDTRSNFLDSTSVEATIAGSRFALTASLADSRQTRLWGSAGAQYVGESCVAGRNCAHEGSDVSSAPYGGPSFTLTYLPNHTAFARDPSYHPVNTQEFLNYLALLGSVYASGQLRGQITQDAVYRPLLIPGKMWLNNAVGLYEQGSTGAQIGVAAASLEDMLRRGGLGVSLGAGAAYGLMAGLNLFPALTDAQWSVVTPTSSWANTTSLNAPAVLAGGGLAVVGAYTPVLGTPGRPSFTIANIIMGAIGAGVMAAGIIPRFTNPHPLDGDVSTPEAADQTAREVMAFSASKQLQYRADQMNSFQVTTLGASWLSLALSRAAMGSTWIRGVEVNANANGGSLTVRGNF